MFVDLNQSGVHEKLIPKLDKVTSFGHISSVKAKLRSMKVLHQFKALVVRKMSTKDLRQPIINRVS